MFTAAQIVAHLVGDYVLQSHTMATRKTSSSLYAASHVIWYMIPLLFFRPSLPAYLVMAGTHFAIDRWRLARYVCWLKNAALGSTPPWNECSATGFPPETPPWLAFWLLIIVDNILHICINGAALRWL